MLKGVTGCNNVFYCGVIVVFQRCYIGDTLVLQGVYSRVQHTFERPPKMFFIKNGNM